MHVSLEVDVVVEQEVISKPRVFNVLWLSMVVYDSAVQQPIVAHRYIVNIIMSTILQVDLCSSIEAIPEHPGFADKGKGHTMGGIHSIDAQG